MAKDKKNLETSFVPENVTDEQPIKRLSDYTEEKKDARIHEEMISALDPETLFLNDAIIVGYSPLRGGSTPWIEVILQGATPGFNQSVMTNSPAITKKLGKVGAFPVLAKFTRREVRGKFRYDLE